MGAASYALDTSGRTNRRSGSVQDSQIPRRCPLIESIKYAGGDVTEPIELAPADAIVKQNAIRRVFWLASYPKSGNTWVRMLLQGYLTGRAHLNEHTYVRGDEELMAYQAVLPCPLQACNREQVALVRYAALMDMSARSPANRTILKTHNARVRVLGEIEMIPSWISQAAVYIVRDPRDVVISLSEHIGQTIDHTIDLMGSHNAQMHFDRERTTPICSILTAWWQHVDSWASAEFPVVLVRYEDLLANPHREFRRILEAFQYEPEGCRIDQAVQLARFSRLREQEQEHGFVEASRHTEFFSRGKSGGWRDILSETQVRRIERTQAAVMERLGYELEG